jgi:TonB family protein
VPADSPDARPRRACGSYSHANTSKPKRRPVGLNRWRTAIENYVPAVTSNNQAALGSTRAAFAHQINEIHNHLHQVFAFKFLGSLDSLSPNHKLNDRTLENEIEIVLDENGEVCQLGVVTGSGSTAFDVGALESIARAAPFAKPPPSILSPDGLLYLHWEFHRDPIYACSTYFVHPFKLKSAPSQ